MHCNGLHNSRIEPLKLRSRLVYALISMVFLLACTSSLAANSENHATSESTPATLSDKKIVKANGSTNASSAKDNKNGNAGDKKTVSSSDSTVTTDTHEKPVAEMSAQEKALKQIIKEAEAEQKPEQLEQKQELIDDAVSDFIARDKDGNEVVCSKQNTVATEVDGKVRYRCRSESQALGEEPEDKRGEGETNQLIDDLMNNTNQSDEKQLILDAEELKKLEAVKQRQQAEREKAAAEKKAAKKAAAEEAAAEKEASVEVPAVQPSEDSAKPPESTEPETEPEPEPESEIISEIPEHGLDGVEVIQPRPDKDDKSADTLKPEDDVVELSEIKEGGFVDQASGFFKHLPIKAYFSLRTNATSTPSQDLEATDGGSRGGLIYADRLENDDQLILHLEVGVDVFGNINSLLHPDGENEEDTKRLRRRLSYLRYGRDDYYVVFGKNWSVYHFIASMTDRFISVGGKASGIYNASTDGGATGTGRADNALQIRSSRGNLQWGLQIQSGTDIPALHEENVTYQLNAGIAGKWKSLSGYSIGAAANRAVPAKFTDEMLARGQDGSSDAVVVAAEFTYDNWFIANTLSRNSNQVTDDTGHYYDAHGWELYSRYNFTHRYHGRFGFNWQNSIDKDYLGEHEIREVYLSFDYSYNRLNPQDRVYAEFVSNHGYNADGTDAENLLVLGFHLNLSN